MFVRKISELFSLIQDGKIGIIVKFSITTISLILQSCQRQGGEHTPSIAFRHLPQTLPELVTPLKRHSLYPRSCPPTLSAPSERFGC